MECPARGNSSPCLKAGDSLPHPVEQTYIPLLPPDALALPAPRF
jgi:hypothetical protein